MACAGKLYSTSSQFRPIRSLISIQTSTRNGVAIGASLVNETDEIMLISDNGILVRTRVREVREMGRATQGVRLINRYLEMQVDQLDAIGSSSSLVPMTRAALSGREHY